MILEILVSTMNRTEMSFLDKMFENNNMDDLSILIINQTSQGKTLKSNKKNIRIINNFDKGLSKSRNLAIENAIGDICLLADDDIVYVKDFKNYVIEAFNRKPEADIITFQMEDEQGNLFKEYPNIDWHTKKSLITVNSVVIAFKRKTIISSSLTFNPHFGLGAQFSTGDEYIFLMDALKNKLKIFFEKRVILSHDFESSGRDFEADHMIFARSAIMRKYSGKLSYLRLLKYLLHGVLEKEIQLKDFFSKYLVGVKGILSYQELIEKEKQNSYL